MNVRLINYSQPSKEMIGNGINDVQDMIAFCARVSNPSNQYKDKTSEKLSVFII